MKKSKCSAERIIRILHEVAAGAKWAETYRKNSVSETAHRVWKATYACMEVSQLRCLQEIG